MLQPAAAITYNEDLTVNGTGRFNSVYIGRQGVGGVTFFNGTIVNATTGANDYDNPVTFGDGVRIDGFLWGGPNKGNAEDQGLKIGDTLLPGLTDINDIGSSSLRWRNLYLSGDIEAGNVDLLGDIKANNVTASGAIITDDIQSNNINLTGNIEGVDAEFKSISATDSINLPNASLNPEIIKGTAWTSINDGVGSGLNADLLDGMHATSFSPLNHNHNSLYVSQANPVWNDKTSYISISAAAFEPFEETYDYTNSGFNLLTHNAADNKYYANVNLPHNAVITRVDYYWQDTDASLNSTLSLNRIANNDPANINYMALLNSTGSSGNGTSYDDTIVDNLINNNNNHYYIYLNMSSTSLSFYSAKISYTIDQPY